MARPTHVDAQRTLTLLEEQMVKLRVLSWLTEENLTQVSQREEELSVHFGAELVAHMVNHLRLVMIYDELINAHSEIHKSDDIELVVEELRRSTLELTRILSRNIDKFNLLKEVVGTHGSSRMSRFLTVGSDLKRLCLAKFTTPIEEEQSRERELLEVEDKLRRAKEEESNWEKNLNLLRRERERAKESRAKEMNELRTELGEVRTRTQRELRKISDNSTERQNRAEQAVTNQLLDRKDKYEKLSKELDELKKANADKEVLLRKNKQKAIVKLTDLIVGYDKDMAEKTETYNRRNEKYQLEKTRLDALEKRYRQLEYEKQRLAEEERKEQARREAEEKAIMQRDLASEYIQAHWKGYVLRAEYSKLFKKWKKKNRR